MAGLMKIMQYIKKKLIIIKQTRLWYFFVRFFFIPFFDFIWVNIINFQGRLLAIIFLFKQKDFYKIRKYEDAKFIKDDPEFQKIAYKIKNFINKNLIDELKNKLESEKTNDPTKNQYDNYVIRKMIL